MMRELFDILGSIGGILSLFVVVATFFLREYFGKVIARHFFSKEIIEKYGVDRRILRDDATVKLQAKLVEKIFDIRVSHIDHLSQEAWKASDTFLNFVSTRLAIADMSLTKPLHEDPNLFKSFTEFRDQLTSFSRKQAVAKPFIPDSLSTAASKFFDAGIKASQVLKKDEWSENERKEVTQTFWEKERTLIEELHTSLLTSIDLPKMVSLALSEDSASNSIVNEHQ